MVDRLGKKFQKCRLNLVLNIDPKQLQNLGHFTAWAPLRVVDGHHQIVRIFVFNVMGQISFCRVDHLLSSLAINALG